MYKTHGKASAAAAWWRAAEGRSGRFAARLRSSFSPLSMGRPAAKSRNTKGAILWRLLRLNTMTTLILDPGYISSVRLCTTTTTTATTVAALAEVYGPPSVI